MEASDDGIGVPPVSHDPPNPENTTPLAPPRSATGEWPGSGAAREHTQGADALPETAAHNRTASTVGRTS